ncbi:MAG: phospholipase D-like domain-containing protein [Planctomycetota bacterium]
MTTKRIGLLLAILAALSMVRGFGGQSAEQTPPAAEQARQGAGPDTWAALDGFRHNPEDNPVFQALSLANESIDIEIYEMADLDIRAALRNAINRKPPIRVRVVKEPNPVGEPCRYFEPAAYKDTEDCKDQKNLVAEIRASPEGEFVPFNKKELCKGLTKKGKPPNCFQHGKLILIDGRHALLGTGNLNSSNLCNLRRDPSVCNRDFFYVTSDPNTVGTLKEIFENDLTGRWYDLGPYLTESISEKLTISGYSLDNLMSFISRARKSIRIENQYLKEKTVIELLKEKAIEGVKVQAMVSSLCSFGKPRDAKSSRALFEGFDDAGVNVRMFTSSMKVGGKPGYLHAKAIVVDDKEAWVGSINVSDTAMKSNREFGIFFSEPADVQRLKKILDADYSDPMSETWEESLRCAKDTVRK